MAGAAVANYTEVVADTDTPPPISSHPSLYYQPPLHSPFAPSYRQVTRSAAMVGAAVAKYTEVYRQPYHHTPAHIITPPYSAQTDQECGGEGGRGARAGRFKWRGVLGGRQGGDELHRRALRQDTAHVGAPPLTKS
eukprot:4818348-Pyramimonas_sp.AAC.2